MSKKLSLLLILTLPRLLCAVQTGAHPSNQAQFNPRSKTQIGLAA
jgi:hypothetical protein